MSAGSVKAPHLSHICLRVRDPVRSADFYQAVLGLKSVQSSAEHGESASCGQQGPDGQSDFEVVFTEGLPPGDHLTGLDRVSFEVPTRELVDHVYEEARKRNARAIQPRLYEGHWQTFIFDPDGYKVEVFTRAPDGAIRSAGDSD